MRHPLKFASRLFLFAMAPVLLAVPLMFAGLPTLGSQQTSDAKSAAPTTQVTPDHADHAVLAGYTVE